jgi:SHS2 domain-containing protein
MPFEEVHHMADWSIRVWAQDLPTLLTESARGMYSLCKVEFFEQPRIKRTFEAKGIDDESLLVAFLSELVYYAEHEYAVFDNFEISIKNDRLKVEMEGAPLKALNKAIKAVTWHNLKVEETMRGLEVEIVFDV